MKHIEDNLPHEVAELICLKCLNRWIGVFPTELPLKDIECKCGEIGYVITTGQIINDNVCDKCQHYKNGCRLNLHYDEAYGCGYFS